MGFEGLVMTVSVREFLFDGIKTGSSGWMIGMKMINDKPELGDKVTYITDRLPITAFGQENGFALFNHKNDTMENEWYEVSDSTIQMQKDCAQVETEQSSWENHTMITKWGQQKRPKEETTDWMSENNMLPDLYNASRNLPWSSIIFYLMLSNVDFKGSSPK